MTIECVECGTNYVMTAQESARFDNLFKTVPGFRMPRRCAECRKIRREDKKAAVSAGHIAPAPAPTPTVKPVDVREGPPQILLVLATKDFDDLVHGRSVIWQGVKVVLADIGFDAMRNAIEDAELAKAKKLIKANGR